MRYFYIDAANQAVGPVEGEALADLRRQGAIGDSTRVAREGDPVWRAFSDFYRLSPPAARPAPLPEPPLSIRVFGVGNIVFGVMGLLCLPVTGAILAFASLFRAETGRAEMPVWHAGWLVFALTLSFFLVIALLVSGVGLCRLREWGRKLALAYAWVDVVQSLVAFGVNLYVSPWTTGHAGAAVSHGLAAVFYTLLLAIGLTYPVLLLVFLRRASVREALQARG